MSYRPEFAWAMAWTTGHPRPFIAIGTVASTRRDVIEDVGKHFAKEGETPQEGWRRAYRRGARSIRVVVSPAFGAKAAGIPVKEA